MSRSLGALADHVAKSSKTLAMLMRLDLRDGTSIGLTNHDQDRVFDVLRAAHVEEPTNWSRRYKANLEKLHSGDVMKVSEVVRDLWRRERDRGLSAGEKRMLAKARQILVSELALAEKTNEDKAEAMLDEVLAS